MNSPRKIRRLALLVGVDYYLPGSSRTTSGHSTLELSTLGGCVNDVAELGDFLGHHFEFERLTFLTSACPTAAESDVSINTPPPHKQENRLPTFTNIKQEFDAASEHLTRGDLFYFHFSGHGACLASTKPGFNHRTEPSLLTADFNCGEPAVRGWQLNNWLRRLSEKGIRVVVSLDSCHSGGAFREGVSMSLRTPKKWPNLPNLEADMAAVKGEERGGELRDAALGACWSVNPDGLTLMAACRSNETAAEELVGQRIVGVFTHALLSDLREHTPSSHHSTYRAIQGRIESKIRHQSPLFFGEVRLLFLGHTEPFTPFPIPVTRNGGLRLWAGGLQGVCIGSEFSSLDAGSLATFRTDWVDDRSAAISNISETSGINLPPHFMVLPSRWSFGDRTLHVVVGPSESGPTLSRLLLEEYLAQRIASPIEVLEGHDDVNRDGIVIRLSLTHERFYLEGTDPDFRYKEPFVENGRQSKDLVADAAIAISHLARFVQVFQLKDTGSQNHPPFRITWSLIGGDQASQSFSLKNTGDAKLQVSLVNFGPGFHVAHLGSWVVPRLRTFRSSPITIEVPDRIRSSSAPGTRCRDVLRIIVTSGGEVLWPSLELPPIWKSGEFDLPIPSRLGSRDASLMSVEDFDYWIEDHEVWTAV